MLRSFSDHAANERTFLAWIRTGIAVLGFGFVIEKFNVFLLAIVSTATTRPDLMTHLERLAGPLGRDEGLALMIVGVLIMLIGGVRYIRTDRLIDDPELRAEGSGRIEVLTAAGLALLASAFCVYLVII
jgi:putative membrane protein